jgi:glycosyltransferase involved in cell wall biosynthesis
MPDDAAALAEKIGELAADPARRMELGRAGAARVRTEFSFEDGIESLAGRFGIASQMEGEAQCVSRSMRR